MGKAGDIRQSIGLVLFALFLLLLHRSLAYIGHFGYDDMAYAQLAIDALQGKFHWLDHFSYRWLVIYPLALCYKIGGVNDWASSLPALLSAWLTAVGVVYALRAKGLQVQMVALLMLFLHPTWFFYTDKIMPDVHVAAAFVWALICYEASKQRFHPFWALGCALFLFMAFLAKETIWLAVPVLLTFAIRDHWRKGWPLFWIVAGLGGLGVMALYLGLLQGITGDVLARFHAIEVNGYLNACSYDVLPGAYLKQRLGSDFFHFVLREHYALYLLPSLLLCVQKAREQWQFSASPWALATVLLFLSMWLWSISISHYIPMCLDTRHFLLLVPVASIAAAQAFSAWNGRWRAFALVLIALLALGFYREGATQGFWLIPIVMLMVLGFALRNGTWRALLMLAVGLAGIASFIWQGHAEKQRLQLSGQLEAVSAALPPPDAVFYLTGSDTQVAFFRYYFQQGKKQWLQAKAYTYNDFMAHWPKPGETTPVYSICNWYHDYLSHIDRLLLPLPYQWMERDENLVRHFEALNIQVYFAQSFYPALDTLASSVISDSTAAAVQAYSQAFVHTIEALTDTSAKAHWLHFAAEVLPGDLQAFQICLSIEHQGEVIHWVGADAWKLIHTLHDWQRVGVDFLIPADKWREGALVKAYVFNHRGAPLQTRHLKVLWGTVK